MILTALLLALAQTDSAPAPAAAEPEAPPDHPMPLPQVTPQNTVNAQQLEREMKRLQHATPQEAAETMRDLQRRMPKVDPEAVKAAAAAMGGNNGSGAGTPVKMPTASALPDVVNYAALPEADQVKYAARDFFSELIAGDARKVTLDCAFPFQLEDRRLANSEELFQELLRNLRTKRTDLLTLYDIEVLSGPDMEKKYGKPPSRLSGMPWRNPRTYVAVANLSGHAAIAIFKPDGDRWVAVGYHD
jgi:hypothetical protein